MGEERHTEQLTEHVTEQEEPKPQGKGLAKRFSRDLVYSISGLLVMNVVIQFVLYPLLNKWIGAEAWGVALSLIAVVSIMCVSFATGANYSHVVRSGEEKGISIRGDYNVFMVILCAVSAGVAIVAALIIGARNPLVVFGLCCLMVFSLVRYYSDVEFRLTLNYRGFFIYYCVVGAGYLVGLGITWLVRGIIPVLDFWWFAIALGELSAFLFVKLKGHVYKSPAFVRSPQFKRNMASIMALSGAYLLSGIIMNADRLLLLAFVGGAEVTIFYVSTLLGKTVSLLTAPLNGVIIGYLTKHDMKVTRGLLGKFSLIVLLAGVVLSVLTVAVSYPLIWFLYPDLFEVAKQFFIIGSVGQVFYFLAEMVLVVVLRVASEKYQLYINIGYTVLYFALCVPGVILGGIWGLAIGILIANVARFLFAIAFGLKKAGSAA